MLNEGNYECFTLVTKWNFTGCPCQKQIHKVTTYMFLSVSTTRVMHDHL